MFNSDEMEEIYKRAVHVEYALGALARATEQSADFVSMQRMHIYEVSNTLELLRNYQSDITDRLDKVIASFTPGDVATSQLDVSKQSIGG